MMFGYINGRALLSARISASVLFGFSTYMPKEITPVQGNLEKVDRTCSILNQNYRVNAV